MGFRIQTQIVSIYINIALPMQRIPPGFIRGEIRCLDFENQLAYDPEQLSQPGWNLMGEGKA